MELTYHQVGKLKEISTHIYVHDILDHFNFLFPQLASVINKSDFISYIEYGITRAKKSGYSQRGPVRLYLDVMILFGAGFEQDVILQRIKVDDKKDVTQIERSASFYSLVNRYIKSAHGINGIYFKESMKRFRDCNCNDFKGDINYGDETFHGMLRCIYPQRYDFLGCKAIEGMISPLKAFYEKHRLEKNSHKAYVALIMFLFGSSFDQDPLRNKFIMNSLIQYFQSEDVSYHYSITSYYSIFQINTV